MKQKGRVQGLSSFKPKAKSSVNQQVKAGIAAVRDFLAGRSGEATAAPSTDKATRQVVAAELVAAMANVDRRPATGEHGDHQRPSTDAGIDAHLEPKEGDPSQNQDLAVLKKEQERARQLFIEHGYFDEAVEALRGASSSAERAAAANALGLVGSQRGTAHLIAAMFDDDPAVCKAAEEALAKIGEPTVYKSSNVLLEHKKQPEKSKVSEAVMSAQAPKTDEVSSLKIETEETAQDVQASADVSSKTEHARTQGKTRSPSAKAKPTGAKTSVQPPPQSATVLGSAASKEEEQLLLEEHAVRERVEQLELQSTEKAAARKEAENELHWRIERETKLLDEGATRRAQEEELRKQVEEESARRRLQETEAVAAEQAARSKAEAEAQRLAEEEVSLRLEATKLTQAAEELSLRRAEMEKARLDAAAAARHAEAKRAREEADKLHKAELERLRKDQAALQAAMEKASLRRAEVESARERADKDAERLSEALARMQAAEEAAATAEAERLKIEAEINQRVETEERRLTEARNNAQEEQAQLEEKTRLHSEAEKKRLADLEVMRTKAEVEARQRAEREQQIRSQLESLRIADAEVRKRIEDAEVRRRAAEEAYRLVAEKVQRVEAEAHASTQEEGQILARLEAARRNAAVDAQARTEQEKRIKDEIEMFRRLEEEERPRLEALTLQRSAAEASLQEERERFSAEQEAWSRAEEQRQMVREQRRRFEPETVGVVRREDTLEEIAPGLSPDDEGATGKTEDFGTATPDTATFEASLHSFPDVPPAIASYLHSVDPYKRAAAVAELARSNAKDAFSLIARGFDDHSPQVRNAAARALRKLEPHKTVDLFNRALEEGSDERRQNIGKAIAGSGLATEAIENLVGENREDTYNALSVLFVMAKTGEVQPLVQAIEQHENDEVSRAVIKLLALSGQSEIGDAALQRRVLGVAARSQTAQDSIPDIRLRIAEVEVKRAINSQQSHQQTADGKQEQ